MVTTKQLVEIAKDYYIKSFTVAAKAAIVVYAPFLSSGVLGFLTDKFILWLAKSSAEKMEIQGYFLYIDIRTSSQGNDYFNAIRKLNDLSQSGIAGPQLEEAKENVKKTFEIFAKFNS